MRDLIRMAAGAIHYLAVFDDHTGRPLYLGRQQRIATADQRLICHAQTCADYALLVNRQVYSGPERQQQLPQIARHSSSSRLLKCSGSPRSN
jgi:hypothetical protein